MEEASYATPQAAAAIKKAVAASATGDTNAAAGNSSSPAAAATKGKDKPVAVADPPLTAEELLKLTQRAKDLVKAGRVFAVHKVRGRKRYSKITWEVYSLYLYSLQAIPPPPDAIILQMVDVVPATPPCEVFLDFSWPGNEDQRVVLHLFENTPAGRQFVLLCTGQRGPCYANTKLFRVGLEGEAGQTVRGGDYETNNGYGGATLVHDLSEFDYWRSDMEGALFGPMSTTERGAQFGIVTTNCWPGGRGYPGVFGEVQSGLYVLQWAAEHHPITDVTVARCGVLLTPYHDLY